MDYRTPDHVAEEATRATDLPRQQEAPKPELGPGDEHADLLGRLPAADRHQPDLPTPDEAASERVRDALAARHPEVAAIVERLVADHERHALDLTRRLRTEPNDRDLAIIREIADGQLLRDQNLTDYQRDNPGRGPLFEPVPRDVNVTDSGQSRKELFIAQTKDADPSRAVGSHPDLAEREQVERYGEQLDEVRTEIRGELFDLCDKFEDAGNLPPHLNIRAKSAEGILEKVERMSEGSPERPGRPGYQVGDVIDAVGARITVDDTEQLGRLLSTVQDHFGTGDSGRIVEIQNTYESPKPHNPAYRLVSLAVTVELDSRPYAFELQLCTRRASVAADIEHNTVYKQHLGSTDHERNLVQDLQAEAAALDLAETRRHHE